MTRPPVPTPNGAAPRAGPTGKSDAVWSATLPASSTDSWRPTHPLTQHRSVRQHDHQSKQTVETHTMRQSSLCPGKRPPAAATRVRHDPSSGVVAVTGSRCDDAVERGGLASLLPRGQAAWVAGWRSEQGGTRTRSGNDLPASRWYSEDDQCDSARRRM